MSKRLLIILSFILLLVACKPKESIILTGAIDRLSDGEVEKLILNRNRDISTIKLGKVNFYVNINGEELKSGGTIGIISDSVVVISLIPAMGYEISRIFCYKDKILVLDRLEKTFFYTSLQKNMNKYKINSDFSDIESLLNGRAFIYGIHLDGTRVEKSVERNADHIELSYKMLEKGFERINQEVIINKNGLITETNNITDKKENININIIYTKYNSVDGFNLPKEITLVLNSSDHKLKLKIEIGTVVINDKINAQNTIPPKYEEALIDY